jgi:hypothetical protein
VFLGCTSGDRVAMSKVSLALVEPLSRMLRRTEETIFKSDDPFYSEVSCFIDVIEGGAEPDVIRSSYADAIKTYELVSHLVGVILGSPTDVRTLDLGDPLGRRGICVSEACDLGLNSCSTRLFLPSSMMHLFISCSACTCTAPLGEHLVPACCFVLSLSWHISQPASRLVS